MIVVTGATGVGNVLLRELAAHGAGSSAGCARTGESSAPVLRTSMSRLLRPTCVSTMRSLRPSRGADVVFHLAGIVSIGSTGMARLREVNVEGTRNVIAACRAANVRRLIYTSSVHAFVELPPADLPDETTAIDPGRVRGPYATTKAEATLIGVRSRTRRPRRGCPFPVRHHWALRFPPL